MSNRSATALDRYAKAVDERDAHIAANSPVFKQHEAIVGRIIDAENDLRDIVAEEGAPVSNADFRVTIRPQDQTFVDIEKLKSVAGQTLTPSLIESLIVTTTRPPYISISRQPRSI